MVYNYYEISGKNIKKNSLVCIRLPIFVVFVEFDDNPQTTLIFASLFLVNSDRIFGEPISLHLVLFEVL